jgi:hypothetical protein
MYIIVDLQTVPSNKQENIVVIHIYICIYIHIYIYKYVYINMSIYVCT